MPRIFAIDWDRNEARAILLQSGPTGTSVAGAWAAKLEAPEGAPLSGKQIGERLAAVMGGESVGKATTIVGVGRDHTQIKMLELPPSPEDELPELVRFQAEREFTALGSEAALDYIPLLGDAETKHQVLAVALSPAGIAEAREVAQAAGAEVNRITVRALAAVSLVERTSVAGSNIVTLVVNPLADEADLIVLEQGKVILLRTVRLPDADQGPARQRALVGEIRRTIAAARQQVADRPVDQVLVCGNAAAADKVDGLGEELGVTVKLFDPAAGAPSGFANMGVPAESLARFAAVLGMAQAEVDRRPPIVDFLNVRRKKEPRKFGREHTLIAAAAAAVLLLIGSVMWLQSHGRASKLASLRFQTSQMNAEIKKLKPITDQADAISQWRSTDVNWLEELTDVSMHLRPKPMPRTEQEMRDMERNGAAFPEQQDVFVKQQLIFGRPSERNSGGGLINIMQAIAKNQDAAADLETRFTEDERGLVVSSPGGMGDTTVSGYTWKMDNQISVPAPPDADIPAEVVEPGSAKTPAAQPAKPAAAEPAKGATETTKAAAAETKQDNKESKAPAGAADKKDSSAAADKKEAAK